MSLYYKFVAVRQEGFFSSSPRWLCIHFFFKALVGEHRLPQSFVFLVERGYNLNSALQPRRFVRTQSQIFFNIQIFSDMRFYINLAALALAACTASPALSAPLR